MVKSNGNQQKELQPAGEREQSKTMHFWRGSLKRLFADKVYENLTADQNVAILEALEIGVVADGEVTEEEIRLVRSDVWKLPWAWNHDDAEIEELVEAARLRVDRLKDDEDALLDYTETVAERIPAGPVREAVYAMMLELCYADGAGEWERDVLEVFRKAAGIDAGKAAAMAEKLKSRGVI